jgi:hypothetical protein
LGISDKGAGNTATAATTAGNSQNNADSGSIGKNDTVTFTGGPVYVSSTAGQAATTKNVTSTCKVTAINTNGAHPYHCISQDGKGVYGWVNADSVRK